MRVLKKKKITSEQKKGIIDAIKDFLNKDKKVLFAYLYGSFAEGNKFNDIDLAVYFDEEQFRERSEIFDYGLKYSFWLEDIIGNHFMIDLHPLNITPLSFRFAVITKGKLFQVKDDDKRVDFEVLTRDLYFDFQPHFQYYYRTAVLGETI